MPEGFKATSDNCILQPNHDFGSEKNFSRFENDFSGVVGGGGDVLFGESDDEEKFLGFEEESGEKRKVDECKHNVCRSRGFTGWKGGGGKKIGLSGRKKRERLSGNV